MSIAQCCPYDEDKAECKYEKHWFHPRFDKCSTCSRKKVAEESDLKRENEQLKAKSGVVMICPTCKIVMLQCKYLGGGIYWTCGKCGCKVESTGVCCNV